MELGEEITIVATDAFQFAKRVHAAEKSHSGANRPSFRQVMCGDSRMMDETEADVELSLPRRTSVSISSTRGSSRACSTADYIKYRNILPKDHPRA
jgi:hypothetical protein